MYLFSVFLNSQYNTALCHLGSVRDYSCSLVLFKYTVSGVSQQVLLSVYCVLGMMLSSFASSFRFIFLLKFITLSISLQRIPMKLNVLLRRANMNYDSVTEESLRPNYKSPQNLSLY